MKPAARSAGVEPAPAPGSLPDERLPREGAPSVVAARPRVVRVVGPAASSSWPALVEALEVETRAPEVICGLHGIDLVLLDTSLSEETMRGILDGLEAPGRSARPAVVFVTHAGIEVPTRLLERADDVVSGGSGDGEVLVRVRAALRARGMLLELSRKNSELEELSGRLEALARRMADELRLASQVQRSLLAHPMPHPRLDVAREYIPVGEIGGDYYDLVPLGPHRLAFAIGDVMGKGVPAALLAANLKACLRAHLPSEGETPAALITRVNRLFWEVTPKGLFASLFFGILDLSRGVLEFVNAGHDHPFLLRSDLTLTDLEEGGTVLGLVEDSRYENGVVAVGQGDLLVLYTDGITDRQDRQGELFGAARLKEAALRYRLEGARLALYSLLGEVQGWSDGLPAEDDMTLIVAQVR